MSNASDIEIKHHFPDGFIWGTSTAFAQIETASAHDWKDVKALDGSILNETIRHENFIDEDVDLISMFGNSYRLSLDWAKLQSTPFAAFDKDVIDHYRKFILALKEKDMTIMMVCHHFTNPLWFNDEGHWLKEENISFFLDYVKQLIHHFSDLVDFWNTFNEPMVYIGNAFLLGNFPPFEKNPRKVYQVLRNIVKAHQSAYTLIKKYSDAPVGISKNCVWFYARNPLGYLPSLLSDYFFNTFGLAQFASSIDFIGLSYYAKIGFDPFPLTYIDRPEKFETENIPHDMMWEYAPEGLEKIIRRVVSKYQKPIIITENGIASASSAQRIESIRDYLKVLHKLISEGLDIRGYFHWSTFDNFEWHLGRTYTFGLVSVNKDSFERKMKDCGLFYKELTSKNGF